MAKHSFSKYSPTGTASDSQIDQVLISINLLGQHALFPVSEVTVCTTNSFGKLYTAVDRTEFQRFRRLCCRLPSVLIPETVKVSQRKNEGANTIISFIKKLVICFSSLSAGSPLRYEVNENWKVQWDDLNFTPELSFMVFVWVREQCRWLPGQEQLACSSCKMRDSPLSLRTQQAK